MEAKFVIPHRNNADKTVLNQDGNSYTYDANGNMTREIYRNSDGSVEAYDDYEYHANGKLKTEKTYRPDGTLEYLTEYDEDGNIVKFTEYENDGITPKKEE